MKITLSDLKMVTLECPYDNWDVQDVSNLFSKIVSLKFQGYRKEHPYGVLPVDTTDFLATHHLVCSTQGGELAPIMGFKVITLERCQIHRMGLPLVSMLQSSDASRQAQAVSRIVDEARQNQKTISFASSWTIRPEIREEPYFTSTLIRYLIAQAGHHYREQPADTKFACGACGKTDSIFIKMGYEYLKDSGGELPSFRQSSLMGGEAIVLQCKSLSPDVERIAARHRGVWEDRIVLGRRMEQLPDLVAA